MKAKAKRAKVELNLHEAERLLFFLEQDTHVPKSNPANVQGCVLCRIATKCERASATKEPDREAEV